MIHNKWQVHHTTESSANQRVHQLVNSRPKPSNFRPSSSHLLTVHHTSILHPHPESPCPQYQPPSSQGKFPTVRTSASCLSASSSAPNNAPTPTRNTPTPRAASKVRLPDLLLRRPLDRHRACRVVLTNWLDRLHAQPGKRPLLSPGR